MSPTILKSGMLKLNIILPIILETPLCIKFNIPNSLISINKQHLQTLGK